MNQSNQISQTQEKSQMNDLNKNINVLQSNNVNSIQNLNQGVSFMQNSVNTNQYQKSQSLPQQQQQQFSIQFQQQYQQLPQQSMFQYQQQQAPQQFYQIQQQQQQTYQPLMPTNKIFNYHNGKQSNSLRLLNKAEQIKNKEVVAVIVTINKNGSYDHLFATVEQKSQEGTTVLVYEASSAYIDNFIKAFEGNPQDDVAKQMMIHIGKVHADCVVFNWECCGFYASKYFPQGSEKLFSFLKIILDKGHMAMFSDFSLKALINDWKQPVLGPNPFVQTGQTSVPINMRFNAGDLKECPSAQLQIVGEMAEGGSCNINVLGGTIVYSVNKNKIGHQHYKLKVLSISTTQVPPEQNYQCSIGQVKGSACHVLLTYPSGGMILTSMGHWIELMKIDTSDKKLFEVAEKNFGKQYAVQMQQEYSSLNVNQQKEWVSKNSIRFVQNQAPCSNMAKKAKY